MILLIPYLLLPISLLPFNLKIDNTHNLTSYVSFQSLLPYFLPSLMPTGWCLPVSVWSTGVSWSCPPSQESLQPQPVGSVQPGSLPFFYYPPSSVLENPLHKAPLTHKSLVICRKPGTCKNPSQKTAIHCLFHWVFSISVHNYLKGMEKVVPPSYAKYCRMAQSKSLVLLDFLVSSVTYLNAFLMQYLTISYFVLRNFLNLRERRRKTSLSD